MCFSATASFTAAAVLGVIGVVCVARAPTVRTLPIAAMPLIFAVQQATEGGLWLWLTGDGGCGCFAGGFSFFAQVLWPIAVPFAVWLAEPPGRRRTLIALTGLAGLIVGGVLLAGLVEMPIIAQIVDGHIFYRSGQFDRLYNAGLFVPATALYVAATCGSFLLSRDRLLNFIGGAMAAAFALTEIFYETWLISIWCLLAASLSGLILVWINRQRVNLSYTMPLKPMETMSR